MFLRFQIATCIRITWMVVKTFSWSSGKTPPPPSKVAIGMYRKSFPLLVARSSFSLCGGSWQNWESAFKVPFFPSICDSESTYTHSCNPKNLCIDCISAITVTRCLLFSLEEHGLHITSPFNWVSSYPINMPANASVIEDPPNVQQLAFWPLQCAQSHTHTHSASKTQCFHLSDWYINVRKCDSGRSRKGQKNGGEEEQARKHRPTGKSRQWQKGTESKQEGWKQAQELPRNQSFVLIKGK